MKRGRSTGKHTQPQAARFDAIWQIGCIVAYTRGIYLGDRPVPAEIHHLTIDGKHGAKRRGHDFTIGINSWSRRREPFGGMFAARSEELFGLSYAKPRRFRQEIGNREFLLDPQNRIIEQYAKREKLGMAVEK